MDGEIIRNIVEILITGVFRGGLYSLIAVGLALIFGVMNISNFAHGEYYMLGAYFGFFAFTSLHLGPIGCILVAGLGTFLVGYLTEKLVFLQMRKYGRGDWVMNTFLVTVGISVVLQNLAKLLWTANYRGIPALWGGVAKIGTLTIAVDRVMALVIAVIAIAFLWFFLEKTKVGRAIRAVSQNEAGAMLLGINLKNIYALTLAVGCAMAGIAGACLLSVTPAYPTVGLVPLYKAWFVVILVGMGNVEGSIVGGLLVGLLETVSYYFLGAGWQDSVSLLVIALILLFKPSGLFGGKAGVQTAWER
ncbi:MAG TPA: branched-chain amino acid ABC transporter permease [Syntrophaceticus sp.]|nr:branched-chain amino acid ABC transporter permease [Syntrophaceticus schinkii]MDD4261046.1 branched-chain amino acid ABC transporter permease [Syntrophaceticus schinkii]MDD4674570.1 branched-chain amino acid ABC transporter permease [Syntrophaceticus schinkii]HHY30906.1 branched-chain amino acid ABC transporter permease [Syntrophaceticus sp.]